MMSDLPVNAAGRRYVVSRFLLSMALGQKLPDEVAHPHAWKARLKWFLDTMVGILGAKPPARISDATKTGLYFGAASVAAAGGAIAGGVIGGPGALAAAAAGVGSSVLLGELLGLQRSHTSAAMILGGAVGATAAGAAAVACSTSLATACALGFGLSQAATLGTQLFFSHAGASPPLPHTHLFFSASRGSRGAQARS